MRELTDDEFEDVAAQLQVNVWQADQAAKEQRKAFLNTPKGQTVAWANQKDQAFDDSIIACTELEFTDQAGWEKWIKINTGDKFVDIVTRWAKLMQFEIDVNHKPLAKIADDTLNRAAHHSAEDGLNYSGLWKLNL